MIEAKHNGQLRPEVTLTGADGNAWAIMGKVSNALKVMGCPPEHVEKYMQESMGGDYDNLLRVACEYAIVK